jgi:preprotein translocase subunit SecA
MFELINKIFGNPNERKIKKLAPIIDHINDLEADWQKLSDDDLRRKTQQFQQELENREHSDNPKRDRELEGEVLDLLLPEAFATVREASRRVLNMRHYDVQLIGGILLHNRGIAEMRTGEGKTLVATLPAYLNALAGKGVHIITVNDYLAQRDAEWMGQIYQFLGLSVGMVLSQQRGFDSFAQKKHAYACDITYGTNNEFGFDYLRDNMADSKQHMCQRPYNMAIVDEVDSILIDEARTPLIISGRVEQSAETYQTMTRIAPQLKREDDFTVDEKARNVILTEEGIDRAQELLQVEDLFDFRHNLAHHLLQALKAQELFKKDVDYVVKNDEVVIVDPFTGRLMEGRRWSDGQHQAIEAKEGVRIQDETQTLASITFQNLFRLYPKLAGMTGTALTEEAEFGKIYSLEVTATPTNRKDVRKDHSDVIYKTVAVKFFKVIEEIAEAHEKGQPVLVGTVSIENSEKISEMLTHPRLMTQHLIDKAGRLLKAVQDLKDEELEKNIAPVLKHPERYNREKYEELTKALVKHPDLVDFMKGMGRTAATIDAIRQGIPHHVLNAKHHEKEAMIVAQAGRYQAVTIATNMAGRGTDILLGGNPEFLVKQAYDEQGIDWRTVSPEEFQEKLRAQKIITDEEKKRVVEAGGLHIIGTERHESRRIDNQLRGRAARQGDPGSTKFYLSLEDPLMRLFGGQKISGLMDVLNVDETMPITAALVSRAIEGAQRKVEAYHFDIRKNILQYDDVLTEQRKLIYDQRRQVLEGKNLRKYILGMLQREMERAVESHLTPEGTFEDWEPEAVDELLKQVHWISPQLNDITKEKLTGLSYPQLVTMLKEKITEAYHQIEAEVANQASEIQSKYGLSLSGMEDDEPLTSEEFDKLSREEQEHLLNPFRRVERKILLETIDEKWVDYLHNLDSLREGIGLRAYGQKDPLIEYKREAFEMFQKLTYDIERETSFKLLRSRIVFEIPVPEGMELPSEGLALGNEPIETPLTEALEHAQFTHPTLENTIETESLEGLGAEQKSPVTSGAKPGPHDPCPCGSGRKYTKCHGA